MMGVAWSMEIEYSVLTGKALNSKAQLVQCLAIFLEVFDYSAQLDPALHMFPSDLDSCI